MLSKFYLDCNYSSQKVKLSIIICFGCRKKPTASALIKADAVGFSSVCEGHIGRDLNWVKGAAKRGNDKT
jgi:hypothetical protein